MYALWRIQLWIPENGIENPLNMHFSYKVMMNCYNGFLGL